MSRIFDYLAKIILSFTIYSFLQSSGDDFRVVCAYLTERRKMDLNVILALFAVAVATDSRGIAASAGTLLLFTNNLRNAYEAHSPLELKERIETVGYRHFAMLDAVPGIGILGLMIMHAIEHVENPFLGVGCVILGYLPALVGWVVHVVGCVVKKYQG
ncbi:hypothetical protein JAAARDRAFT_73028 [Jaapia argillacea MUCL 33604]|uniref:Uncharacterized protein n=1 Tax=Jaapia argillacea MUCL 33604 TaxID=933084 RepID=A0A067PCR4_9AGAM|nr:hypothetical protein JAAARDRAFT_73028 [Jaapia argillacea MUCL 33604]